MIKIDFDIVEKISHRCELRVLENNGRIRDFKTCADVAQSVEQLIRNHE